MQSSNLSIDLSDKSYIPCFIFNLPKPSLMPISSLMRPLPLCFTCVVALHILLSNIYLRLHLFSNRKCFSTYLSLLISSLSHTTVRHLLRANARRITGQAKTSTSSYIAQANEKKTQTTMRWTFPVHTNNTAIQRGKIHERVSIRHIKPCTATASVGEWICDVDPQ